MSILLAIAGWEPEAWMERFRRLAPQRPVTLWPADDSALEEARYAVVWRPPAGLLGRMTGLEAVFNLGAGVDGVLADPGLPAVPVVRMANENLTRRMTEYATLHVLLHHRQMVAYREQQTQRRWHHLPQPSADEVRVGVMGLGVLGLDACRQLASLGFEVAGWSRSPKTSPEIEAFYGAEGLDAFLARTDILVVLLPLTPDTRGILDYSLLAKLARDGALGGPVLINAGRGGLQVEADILRALDEGVLKAASLDVFEEEPLPEASPLWAHPRVVITPHAAADSDPDHLAAAVLAQIERYEAGGALENVVDRERGY